MALVKGTNSYVTLAEANGYFGDRLDVAAWEQASDAVKSQALVTATMLLDNMSNWIGTAISESQVLAFPRKGEFFDTKLGITSSLPATVPDRILKATYELAYHLLNNDGLLDDTGTLSSLSVGPIAMEFRANPSKVPSNVLNIIKPLREKGGYNAWWRNN